MHPSRSKIQIFLYVQALSLWSLLKHRFIFKLPQLIWKECLSLSKHAVCVWCVSKKVKEWVNCYFLYTFPFLSGTVTSRFISPTVSYNMSFFFKLLKKPFSWSVRRPQRARLWLLYPIVYPSSKHALDLNTERQCKQLPTDLSQGVQASLSFLCCYKAWNLMFFVKCTLKQQHLHNTFQIYSRVFWRTRHICYLAIDMLLKTAASGTTVKYALSMTEPSSIMRTSIPSLFPHHFLDLRENIAPWSESIPSYKPLKTT